YGIKSFPFKIADRYDQAVVNSYFSILIKYGDQFEILNFSDLIEVQATDIQNVEVKLRNLEYDLTRTVKKVAFGFQTLDAVFANMDAPAEFYAYITPDSLPENFKTVKDTVQKVAEEIKGESGGKFNFEIIDPDAAGAKESRESLLEKFGFRPLAVSLLSNQTFYLHLLLKVGDRYERLIPEAAASEADLKKELVGALKRAAPGFLKTIGFVKPTPKAPQQPRFPGAPPPPPAQPVTRALEEQLSQTYTVTDVDLSKGRVPRDVDILLLFQPDPLDDKAQFAIDQHLMQGGTVVALQGRYQFEPAMGQLGVKQTDNGLEKLLNRYGIEIQQTLVLDTQNEPIPVETPRTVRGMRVREMGYLKYPYFVDVRSDGMAAGNPVVSSLPALTLPWVSPILVNDQTLEDGEEPLKRDVVALLTSTPDSYVNPDTKIMPDLEAYPQTGFADPSGEQKRRNLAVAITGSFKSAFADGGPIEDAPVVKQSPDSTRLIVVGTSAIANDMLVRLTRQGPTNLQFVQNLVDFGLADTELLTIRSRGTFVRTLLPMEASERARYEYFNYGIVIFGLALVIVLTLGRRRSIKPLDLDPPSNVSSTQVEA
ncbi:MAG: Gldg family protein, partial [Myxococcota bacterium]